MGLEKLDSVGSKLAGATWVGQKFCPSGWGKVLGDTLKWGGRQNGDSLWPGLHSPPKASQAQGYQPGGQLGAALQSMRQGQPLLGDAEKVDPLRISPGQPILLQLTCSPVSGPQVCSRTLTSLVKAVAQERLTALLVAKAHLGSGAKQLPEQSQIMFLLSQTLKLREAAFTMQG